MESFQKKKKNDKLYKMERDEKHANVFIWPYLICWKETKMPISQYHWTWPFLDFLGWNCIHFMVSNNVYNVCLYQYPWLTLLVILNFCFIIPMRAITRLVKRNIVYFIEPINQGVRKSISIAEEKVVKLWRSLCSHPDWLVQ